MQITRKTWNKYISLLRSINDTAANELLKWIQAQFGDGLITTDIRDADGLNILDKAFLIAQEYGNAAGAVSAQMYDAIAELSGYAIAPAELAENASYHEVAKTVNGVLKTSQNREEITSAVGRLVKRTGVRTTYRNARRDGAEFAWIPSGDTCAFCIMLASNGWQNARKTDHAEHIHSNCDCTYAIRFNHDTNIAGYDPDKYLDQYRDAEGSTAEEKINSMRRKYYADNRDEILAEKADRYAERVALNSSSAEETNAG